jgi:biotin carboxyl carrier protein
MKYIVNDRIEFNSEDLSKGVILNQEGTDFRFLYKEKLYDIKLISHDVESKTYTLKINGFKTKVSQSNELDQLIGQLGFNKPPKKELKEVTAPMPGLVKEVFVKEGDNITIGDNLFVLEAMKMENIIKSTGEGTISKMMVQKGDKVEKGNILAKL